MRVGDLVEKYGGDTDVGKTGVIVQLFDNSLIAEDGEIIACVLVEGVERHWSLSRLRPAGGGDKHPAEEEG